MVQQLLQWEPVYLCHVHLGDLHLSNTQKPKIW